MAYACKTVLLKDKYEYSDFENFTGDRLDLLGTIEFRNVIYQFDIGVVSLFRQTYVTNEGYSSLVGSGYDPRNVSTVFDCAGLRLVDNVISDDSESFTYFMTMAAPLLVTPMNYFYFSAFSFTDWSRFWKQFVTILLQVPVFVVYDGHAVNEDDFVGVISYTLAHIMRICFEMQGDNVRTWNFISGTSIDNQPLQHTSVLLGEQELPRATIREVCAPQLVKMIRKGIYEKCYKSWDKLFVDGFFIVILIGNERRVDWLKADSANIYRDVRLNEEFNIDALRNSIARVMRTYLVRIIQNFPDNIGFRFVRSVNFDHARRAKVPFTHNPLGVFCSLNDDDFSLIALLYAQFYGVYADIYRPRSEDYTFLGSLVNLVMSKEVFPNIRLLRKEIVVIFNECISRKLFKLDKITGRTYVRSTHDFAFIYVIPLKLGSYNIKWYLKRDFQKFFQFFDSVYFKPKYLRMLTPEGLSILRRLSKFDSKVIDAVVMSNFPGIPDN